MNENCKMNYLPLKTADNNTIGDIKTSPISECKKNCTDCLHCKVCACSTNNSYICYCAKTKNKERDLEFYWLNKPVCSKFEDMSA